MTTRTPAQYDWAKALFNDRRLTKHFTHPRRSKISHVTLHHMTIVSTGTAKSNTAALEGCYTTWQSRAASANYGVAGDLVWQFVSDFDAPWADANNTSNQATLAIEHANSKAAPGWEIADTTMATGQRLVANLHRLYGLGRPTRKTVRVHRDFYATDCPGPYMMAHLDAYIAAAAKIYDTLGKTTATPKPPSKPKPPVAKKVTVVSAVQNVAGYNGPSKPGVTGYKTHIPNIAKGVESSGADLFDVQELSNRSINRMRPLLEKCLPDWKRSPDGTDGRYVYYRKATITRIAGGHFVVDKRTWYKNDNKQAAWLVFTKDGALGMEVSQHLESDSGPVPDALRCKQALDILHQTLVVAAKYKVPLTNITITGDTNSEGMVPAAMKAAGWVALPNKSATFRGWDGHSHKVIDYAFVIKGVKGSVEVVTSKDSDHNRLIVTRELTK